MEERRPLLPLLIRHAAAFGRSLCESVFLHREATDYHQPVVECDLAGITFSYETFGEGGDPDAARLAARSHTAGFRDGAPLRAAQRVEAHLPGSAWHGKTPGPEWVTCEDQVLDLLEEFIDSVIGGDRFVVAGTSYALPRSGLVHRRQGASKVC